MFPGTDRTQTLSKRTEFDKMKNSMAQRLDPSFARIPAILLWITNALHLIFTVWMIDVGGSGMEMMVLLPLFFLQLPSILLLLISALSMLIVRRHRPAVLENAIPFAIYLLQVAVFWFFAFNK